MLFIRWHPQTGEHKVFGNNEQAPPDWLPYHPDDTAKAGEPEPELVLVKPFTVKEVQELLTSGGVQFDPKAKLADLTELLDKTVKSALIAHGIHHDEAEPTRVLVAKLTDALEKKAA